VSFSVPANGASLASPVHVEMSVSGLQVKPAGESEGLLMQIMSRIRSAMHFGAMMHVGYIQSSS
jgi:hypothetical protein